MKKLIKTDPASNNQAPFENINTTNSHKANKINNIKGIKQNLQFMKNTNENNDMPIYTNVNNKSKEKNRIHLKLGNNQRINQPSYQSTITNTNQIINNKILNRTNTRTEHSQQKSSLINTKNDSQIQGKQSKLSEFYEKYN